MLTPSGRRSSLPVPPSSASGSPPSSAAKLVIMIGLKRSRQAFLIDSRGREPLLALGHQREVDHHDRVLLHDADQEDDPDQRHDVELHPAQHQRQQRAHPRRGQRGEDGHRVDVALVEHAEHDVDGDQRGQDQDRLVRQAVAELLGRPLEAGVQPAGQPELGRWPGGWPSPPLPSAWPGATSKERVTAGELALVVHGERGGAVSTRVTTAESGTGVPGGTADVDLGPAPAGPRAAPGLTSRMTR